MIAHVEVISSWLQLATAIVGLVAAIVLFDARRELGRHLRRRDREEHD